ncbi:hypothetical protein Scep_024955 [Stephania cephalantha]|uniref:Cupin type-1 domain-containing protein n=1 Tax=Stephania cephalantha TaxID=152367 RepID=A0AAP0F0A4_9MAGN
MGLIDCLLVFLIACLTLKSSFVVGSDPSPLQNFCVAIDESNHEAVYVNGKFCKNPKNVTADDFYLSGFDIPSNTSNPFRSNTTLGTVDQIPGLNTLGISVFRADLKPKGIIPVHGHPRGSEMIVVMEGCLYVGFVTSDPNNRLMAKQLKPGDVFVFPPGLVHFLYNDGDTDAVVYAAANSQNPDITTTRGFRNVPVEVLSKSFKAERKVIEEIIKGISIPLIRDLCVAINDLKDAVLVNGKLCKDPSLVTTNDFFLPGFDKPGNTSNAFGSGMTPATIDQIPGLNGLGISLVRIDFAPKVYVNGKFCKNPKLVTPNDFYLSGFDKPGNTSNSFGYNATLGTVDQLPGLNTLGIAMVRADYAPQGLAPMHSHPRGSEVIIVIQGCVYVGFVTSDPENRLIAKELKTGDVFAIPPGLIHFTYNVGDTNATTLAASNSQNSDFLSTRIFQHIPVEILAKSYNVDEKVIEVILEAWKNNDVDGD